LNASFIKAISELLGKSKKEADPRLGAGQPLDVEELLARKSSAPSSGARASSEAELYDDYKSPGSAALGLRSAQPLGSLGSRGRLDSSGADSGFQTPLVKRLKVAVLHRNFDPTAGGAEHYAVALVEELAHLHEFHVFSQSRNHDSALVHYHRVPQWFVRPRWLNQLVFAAYCAYATRKGFDVVHSHENTWSGDVQTVHVIPLTHNLFAGKTRAGLTWQWIKVMLSLRLLTYVILERLRFRARTGRWFIAVSSNMNRLLQYSMGCAPESIMTIAPGVHAGADLSMGELAVRRLHARQLLGLSETASCLLWVGHDAQKKGLQTAIEALRLLPSECVLVVAGAAKPKEHWAHLLSEDVRWRVIEKGVVSAQTLQTLYEACDVLVHPTREDTYAMVVLEAMANALPVIVSSAQYCGISAQLSDMTNALILSDPEDASDLAGKVVLALQGHLGESLSKQARAWAKTQDWSKMGELQHTVYTHIAIERNARAQGQL
jgi:UDP-glucose:(heptosyl)LPS alpha-1,3-glucosyltransferase